ncbi:MAG: hypothetical protein Kow0090_19200 [Myxococcota bacterium]
MKRESRKAKAALAAAIIATLLGLSACSLSDPGSGTNTLGVEAKLTYRSSENLSRVTVVVRNKTGNLVKNADVGLQTETGKIIRIPSDPYSPGYYRETIEGYENLLTLIVKRGEDDYLEATLEGPGRHVIVSPYNDYVLDSQKQPTLLAKWKEEGGGEVTGVQIRTRLFVERFNDDVNSVRLGIERLKRGRELIEVERENSIDLEGGLPGSIFTIKYISSNNFTVD